MLSNQEKKKPTFEEVMEKQKECVKTAVQRYVASSAIMQLEDKLQPPPGTNYIDTFSEFYEPPEEHKYPTESVFYGKSDLYLSGNDGYMYYETKRERRQKMVNNLRRSDHIKQVVNDITSFKTHDRRLGDPCLKPSYIVRIEKRWGIKVKPNYVISYRKPTTVKSAAKACTGRYR
jgi:hypothetical protein